VAPAGRAGAHLHMNLAANLPHDPHCWMRLPGSLKTVIMGSCRSWAVQYLSLPLQLKSLIPHAVLG